MSKITYLFQYAPKENSSKISSELQTSELVFSSVLLAPCFPFKIIVHVTKDSGDELFFGSTCHFRFWSFLSKLLIPILQVLTLEVSSSYPNASTGDFQATTRTQCLKCLKCLIDLKVQELKSCDQSTSNSMFWWEARCCPKISF